MMALLLFATLVLIRGVNAQEIQYAPNLPPGPKPVQVTARFFLSDINDINEQAETFEMKGLLKLKWRDERHAFDSKEEGVSEKRYQGAFQFLEEYNGWWPQLVLANGVGTIPLQNVSLRITPDGTLQFIQEITAVVESPMNLRRYPFDRQQLRAIFEPLAFYATEVKLVTGRRMTDLPERPVHIAGWELLDLRAKTRIDHDEDSDVKYSLFIVTLDVARDPGFTIWFIIVPLSMIVLLTTSVFWLDRESSASRMDVAFIGLLTIVAYQALVVSYFPQIGYFTLISGFVYVAYMTMIACIISIIWADNLYRSGGEVASDRFDRFSRWAFPIGFFVLNLISALYYYFL